MPRASCFASAFVCLLFAASCAEPLAPASSATPPPQGPKADTFGDEGEARWAEIAARCTPPAEGEPVLYNSDFSWGYTLEAMGERFEELRSSGKRLYRRAHVDPDSGELILPTEEGWGSRVVLPRRLVENVTLHIERALDRGYVDYVFFPDMGHSHLLIPQSRWEERYAPIPVRELARRYEEMFADPELLVLYHTAEQLETLDDEMNPLPDRHTQWRFYTRNLVGSNDYQSRLELLTDLESNANTARDLEGYRYYGAGFNLTTTDDGCFPYQHDGQLYWYDISLYDLPAESPTDF